MIRFAAHHGVDAIKLLEENEECEFVLKREAAHRNDMICRRPCRLGMPVRATDENRNPLHAVELPLFDPSHKVIGGPAFAPLIENDSERAFALCEEEGAVLVLPEIFREEVDRNRGVSSQALLVLFDAPFCVGE